LITRDTVATETPAWRAMSRIVARLDWLGSASSVTPL
jgi:hypothetical protein